MTNTTSWIRQQQLTGTPDAPGTGFMRIYPKDDGRYYIQQPDGTEIVLTDGFTGSPLTTKGDIWGYSTTNDRIPVGSNNAVLMPDSSQLLGVRYGNDPTLSGATINNSIIGASVPVAGTFTTLTATAENITGTGGSGYLGLVAQASNASAPTAAGNRLFAGSTGALSWARKNGSDTFVRTFDTTLTADRTWTIFDASDTLVGLTQTQTLTNKTIGITNTLTALDTLFTLQDDGDNTKQTKFQLSGITTGTTITLTVPNASGTIALTSDLGSYLPLAGGTMTGRIVLRTGTASANTEPLQFVSGTLLGASEVGAMEFNTDDLYFTITTGTARQKVALTAGLTSGRVPFVTTNGRLTDSANFTWDGTTHTILSTGNQLKLSYDGTFNTLFATSSAGLLTVTPSGNSTTIAGTLAVTDSSTPTAGSTLLAATTFGNPSGTVRGASLTATATLSGNNANIVSGINAAGTLNQNTFNATSASAVRAVTASVTVNGASGTVTGTIANTGSSTNSGAGTVTTMTGYSSTITNSGGGVLTNGVEFSAGGGTNSSGTFTTHISYAAAAATAATNNTYALFGTLVAASGNWVLYSPSAYNSSLLGNLTVGSNTAGSAMLNVTGNTDINQFIVKGNSTQTSDLVQFQASDGTVTAAYGPSSVASGASATWRRLYVAAQTATITGSTNITTANGFNLVEFGIPTLSTTVTVTNAATVTIVGAPAVTGGGSIAQPLALRVVAGNVRIGSGSLTVVGSYTGTAAIDLSYTVAANTSAAGLNLTNSDVATSGNQRYSPRIRWSGAGWNTSAGGSSKVHNFKSELIPVEGNPSTSYLLLAADPENSGTYTDVIRLAKSAITIADATNIATNTTTGTILAATASQKLAFWAATPIVQPANTVALDTLLVNTGLRASGGVALFDTDVKVGVVGKGIYVKTGANATLGTAALTAGAATVATTKVTATSLIFLTDAGGGVLANIGSLYYTPNVGVGFTVTSSNPLDTSNFNWWIIDQA